MVSSLPPCVFLVYYCLFNSRGAIDEMLTFCPTSEMVLRRLQKTIKIRREEGQRAIDVAD